MPNAAIMQKTRAAPCRAVLPMSLDQKMLARHQAQQPIQSTASRLSARKGRPPGRFSRYRPSTARSDKARPLSTLPPAAASPSATQGVHKKYCEVVSVWSLKKRTAPMTPIVNQSSRGSPADVAIVSGERGSMAGCPYEAV